MACGDSIRASPPLQLFNQSSLDINRFYIYNLQHVEYRKIFISTCFCHYTVVVSTANLLIFTWHACQGSRRCRPTEKILISTSISFTVPGTISVLWHFFHRALLSYLIDNNKKIKYNVHCFCSTHARFLLKNKAQKILIRYEIHKVAYFYSGYWCPPVFFSCFLAWTAISKVYSGMTCHNTSCQQNITVRILVTGSGGDALIVAKIILMQFDAAIDS